MKKQAIFPVLVMLVVAALALIGSSFAWFTVATTATVTTINTKAQSSDVQLMLSYDASNYYANGLTLSTQSYIINPATLYQVSTVGGKDQLDSNGLFKFYDAQVLGESAGHTMITSSVDGSVTASSGILAASPTGIAALLGEAKGATEPTYIVFDLYVSVKFAANLYLYSGTEFTSTDADSVAQNAMRVAFVNLGHVASTSWDATGADIDTNAAADTVNVRALNDVTNATVAIWEPGKADVSPVSTYGLKAVATNVRGGILDSNFSAEQTTSSTSELVVGTDKDVTGKTSIASLQTGYTKIRVFAWLEGQDVDCVHKEGHLVAGKNIKIDLVFYAKKTA